MKVDLADEETTTLVRLLRDNIDGDEPQTGSIGVQCLLVLLQSEAVGSQALMSTLSSPLRLA